VEYFALKKIDKKNPLSLEKSRFKKKEGGKVIIYKSFF